MNTEALPSHELVSTKLFIPPLPPTLLPRPRVMQRLNEALSRKLTLLSAPAGYGKTTLLLEWVSQTALPVAWLSLTEADNDPVRFWSYIVAACQRINKAIGKPALRLLQSLEPPPLEAVLTLLVNDLAAVSESFALILDDYHQINESALHRSLRLFLDGQPPSLHLVLSSRTDPPLALAGRRARGELLELRTVDVRFTLEEATAWLIQRLHLPLSPEQLALLHERTEGWAAALHLATLSLQNSTDLSQALTDFTGSHRYVLDYLVEEVIARQPEEVRAFLLYTASSDRLTGSLCNALTGRSDGQIMLEALERANLFLIPLDGQRRWYRYHQLFAEVLRLRASLELVSEQRISLSRQASAWYEHHGLLLEAVGTALSAADYDTAIRIGTALVPQLLIAGQHATVARWLHQLPRSLLFSQPQLCLAFAWTLLLSGQLTAALAPLREAKRLFSISDDYLGLGQVAAMRALLARLKRDSQAALRWGQEAMALLPEDATAQRGVGASALGYGYRLRGEVALAHQMLTEARLLSEQANSKSGVLGSTLLLGEVLALEGQLTEAAGCYRQVIEAGEIWIPIAIEARLALGAILLEWNDLDGAAAQLEPALRLSQQQEETSLIARTVLFQAQVLQARGPGEQAEERFLRAVVLARQSKHTHLLARARAYQARWWLAQGNMEAVREFQANSGFTGEEVVAYEHEEVALTLARVQLAQDEAATTGLLLERWLALAITQGRIGSQIEILMLQARVADMQGQIQEAVMLLHQAVVLAEGGRYFRLLVQEGPSLTRLLHLLQPRWSGKAAATYLERLLTALSVSQASPIPRPAARTHVLMLSPLTPREYKVLRLLAAGLSMREIANELVVSLNTIKTQVQSLYRKLNASSRDAALVAARTWQLL